jgi:uncharacterized protein (DUF983 family)
VPRILQVLLRGARLRCPCCGYGHLFRSGFTMNEACSACDEKFEREPGQWFGAVYINLTLTALLTVTGFVLTDAYTPLSMSEQFLLWTTVAACAPFAFFRFAKGLWTSIVFLGEGVYLDWPTR